MNDIRHPTFDGLDVEIIDYDTSEAFPRTRIRYPGSPSTPPEWVAADAITYRPGPVTPRSWKTWRPQDWSRLAEQACGLTATLSTATDAAQHGAGCLPKSDYDNLLGSLHQMLNQMERLLPLVHARQEVST